MRRLVLLLALLPLLMPAAAQASTYEPCKWHRPRVGVFIHKGVGSSWHVRGSIAAWNDLHTDAPRLVVSANRHARIHVSVRDLGGDINGETSYTCGGPQGMHVWISLNYRRHIGEVYRAQATRHEFGHALGLGHRSSGQTIMRVWLRNCAFYPTTSDVRNLNRRYP